MVGRELLSARRARFESLESRDPLTANLTAANVLVLYNPASPGGTQIANYYAQVHPGVQLLAISGVDPNSETTTADAYLSTIRPQVLAALTPATEIIVTTKGLPLRIQVTEAAPTAPWPTLPTYVDANGVLRTIFYWQPYSSLESELTNIQTVSTWQMMGDQTYYTGVPFCLNPYYRATESFSHAAYGGKYLTSRLDGYSTSDVMSAIDRAQLAFAGPSGPYFLVDNDPSKTYAPTMANLVNDVLVPAGVPLVYDNTSAFVGTAPAPIIGYDSHGVHQASTPSNYLSALNVTLANGAVFNSWESYNAYSFTPGGYSGGQGQIAQWLAMGGTAAVGNVEEPGANRFRVANEDQLFKMLLSGRTWAEAAWSSLNQLGYVNTVLGDPLMTWNTLPQASAMIAARNLFYNNSKWDGYNGDVGAADDTAIATDKAAYLPGSGTANFTNASSYSRGINGLMVDVAGAHGTITANDFTFKVGNNNSPDLWAPAPAPISVIVRAGAGTNGSDRVEIAWADDAILNTWLEVVVRGNDALGGSNTNTGLAASDVFFWGSAVGDSGADDAGALSVTSADEISARNDSHGIGNPATISNVNDFNRDGLVNSADQIIARTNVTNLGNQLTFLAVGAGGSFATHSLQFVSGSALAAVESIGSETTNADTTSAGDTRIAFGLATGLTAGSVAPVSEPLLMLFTEAQSVDPRNGVVDKAFEQFATADSTLNPHAEAGDSAGEPDGGDYLLDTLAVGFGT